MKGIYKLFCLALIAGSMSCGNKKNTDIIIAEKPVIEQRNDTLSMEGFKSDTQKEWLGGKYIVSVNRYVDKSLPLAEDEQGQKYYDNRISLKITRAADGSTFYEKVFTKSDFRGLLNKEFSEKGALLGIVFDKIEGSKMVFAASVGSPDKSSDEYMPFLVSISNYGEMGIGRDNTLDTANPADIDDEDGV